MQGHETAAGHDNADVRHEADAVNVRGVFGFGFGLIVVAVMIHLMVWLLFQYFDARESARVAPEYPLAIGQENRLPPEPRLQTNPREDLRLLRLHEDELLNNYRWVDKSGGVVRIPIEDAIRLTAQKGLPARPAEGAQK